VNIQYFIKNIEPLLIEYNLKYSSYSNGDFGDLERVIIDGKNKLAGIDFWSEGWLDIDIYDLSIDKQIMSIMLDPTEIKQQIEELNIFVKMMLK
jgi:hypothetical protein